MNTANDNKNSYFAISVEIPKIVKDYNAIENIDSEIDMILSGIQASSYVSRFEKLDKSRLVYIFGTTKRKRKGQLIRLCNKFINKYSFEVDALTKTNFTKSIEEFTEDTKYESHIDPSITNSYRGNDIKLFNEPSNWYEWQSNIYNKVFLKTGSFRTPDPRKIIFVLDKEGNCGKSSFFKWLYFKYPQEIGRITYGTSGQLRSSILNIGAKKLYLIDLPRTKGKEDRIDELLCVIEDIKNGNVASNMYGSGSTLLMEPPHIILSGNYVIDQNALSEDRWESYEIVKKNKKLKNITEQLKRKSKVTK